MKFIIGLIIYLISVWFICRFFKVTSERDNAYECECDESCECKFDEHEIRK